MVKCPLGERWETTVGAVNPTMIIVLDISKDNRLNHVLGHLHRIDTIKFFFLERCEKALHPGIIIASTNTAHTLDRALCSQCGSDGCACKLRPTIRVKDDIV